MSTIAQPGPSCHCRQPPLLAIATRTAVHLLALATCPGPSGEGSGMLPSCRSTEARRDPTRSPGAMLFSNPKLLG
jgi:hypothetical protein